MTGSVTARSTSPEDEPGGEVIPLGGRRRRPPGRTDPGREREAEERIAVVIESLFDDRGKTLTDPDTAEAYYTTLDAVERIVNAVHEQGDLEKEGGYEQLLGWLEAARCTPAVLRGEAYE